MAQCLAKVNSCNVTKIEDSSCRFMDGQGRDAVALVGFPGSETPGYVDSWRRQLGCVQECLSRDTVQCYTMEALLQLADMHDYQKNLGIKI